MLRLDVDLCTWWNLLRTHVSVRRNVKIILIFILTSARLLFSIKKETRRSWTKKKKQNKRKWKRKNEYEKRCQIHSLSILSVWSVGCNNIISSINSAATMLSTFRFEWFALQFIVNSHAICLHLDEIHIRHRWRICLAFFLSRANELAFQKWK